MRHSINKFSIAIILIALMASCREGGSYIRFHYELICSEELLQYVTPTVEYVTGNNLAYKKELYISDFELINSKSSSSKKLYKLVRNIDVPSSVAQRDMRVTYKIRDNAPDIDQEHMYYMHHELWGTYNVLDGNPGEAIIQYVNINLSGDTTYKQFVKGLDMPNYLEKLCETTDYYSCGNDPSSQTGNGSNQNAYAEYLKDKTYLWENEIIEPVDDYYTEWLDKTQKIHTAKSYAMLTHQMKLVGQARQRIICVETFDRYYTQADRYIGSDDSPIYKYPAEEWETFDTTYHIVEEDTMSFHYQIQHPSITFSFVDIYHSAATVIGVTDYYDYNMMLWDSRYPPHGKFIVNDSLSIEMYGVTTNKIDTICRKFAKL